MYAASTANVGANVFAAAFGVLALHALFVRDANSDKHEASPREVYIDADTKHQYKSLQARLNFSSKYRLLVHQR